jgi:hypothetical protein
MSGLQTIWTPNKFVATDEATSTTTGSVIIVGGESIGKNLYVGGNTNINGNSTVLGQISTGTQVINSTIDATNSITGSLTLTGGMGISKSLYIGGDLNVTGAFSTGGLALTATTDSSSTSTGTLIVPGGVGIGKKLYVGDNTSIDGQVSAQSEILSATINSTSTSTGTLTIYGGVGIYKNVYIGGDTTTNNLSILSTTASTDSTTGSLIVYGGVGVSGGIQVAGTSAFTGTVTALTQTYPDNSTKVATDAYVISALNTVNAAGANPTGFENQTSSTLSYSASTRVFSISPVSGSYNVWISGVRYTYSSTINMSAHPTTSGVVYYYYFTSAGLQRGTSYPNFTTAAMCSIVYYYNSSIGLMTEERHGCVMDPATHLVLHEQIGTYYVSGLVASGYTISPAVPTDLDNRFTTTAGVISDEGLNTNILEVAIGGPYNCTQLTGANGIWFWIPSTVPYHYFTNGYIQYNQYTGSTWQLTQLSSDTWVNYYVCFIPEYSGSTQILTLPGQTTYTSAAQARAESFYNLTLLSIPFPEILPMYQITLGTSSTYTSAGKCRIDAFTRIYGSKATILNNEAFNHEALNGLQLASSGVTWGHINDQTQSIYGIKTFANTSNATSISTGSLIIGGGSSVLKDFYVGGSIKSTNTQTSTSITTGALQIAGGAGVNQLYVATTTTLDGNMNMGTNNISTVGGITATGIISTLNTTLSTSTNSGAVRVAGGIGASEIFIANTTTSTSTTTGSLMVAGGIGTNQLYVATTSTMNGNLALGTNDITSVRNITATGTFNINTLQLTNTSLSTSTNSGALQVVGGIGTAEIFIANNTQSTSTTTGSLMVAGGAGINQLYVATTTTMGGNLTMNTNNISSVGNVTSSGIISTTNTTLSTSTTTGAVRIAGGLGTSQIFVANTTTSTSTTTGALMVAGGAGLNQLYVATTTTMGGNLALGTNDITSVRNITSSGTFNVASLQISGTTQSTSTTTGSIITLGGVGITGDVFVGGMVYSASNTAMNAPNGFENQTDSTVSYNPTTRVLTISPTSTSFNVWVNGKRFTYTTTQTATAHTNSIGMYHYYFDPSGVLQWSAPFPSLYASATAFFVYYYSTTLYFVQEERHAPIMDPITHLELHNQIGTYYVSGLALSGYTLAGNTNAANQWISATGEISDEGLQLVGGISANTTPNYNLLYLDSTQNWTWSSGNTMPYSYTVGGNINYNQNTSGTTWALNQVPTNSYVNTYILYVPSLSSTTQVFSVIGQTFYTSLTLAQGEAFTNLTLTNLVWPEFLVLYQLNWRCSNYVPLGKCRLEAVVRIVNSRVSILNNTATNHQTLSGLELASSGVTYGHINDQLQSIYGAKTFADTTASTSGTTGALIVSGGIGANQLYVTTTTNIDGNLTTGTSSSVKINNTNLSTSITTGALQVAGGTGTNQLYVATTTTMGGNLIMGTNDITSVRNITSSGTVQINGTTQSTSTSTGTLITNGGVGINGNVFISGTLYSLNSAITDSPTGFENQNDSTMSYDSTTRVFTISPASSVFYVWVAGKRYSYTTPQTYTHPDTMGLYFYYFTAAGLQVQFGTAPTYLGNAYCCIVYYYSSGIGVAIEERHGCNMAATTHQNFHDNIGTYLISGVSAGNYNISPSSPVDSDNQFSLTSGVVSDEGLLINILTLASGSYTVNQLTGPNAYWTYTTKTVPFNYVVGGAIQYNQLVTGSWTLTPVPNQSYVNYYVCVLGEITGTRQIFIKAGQTVYSSLTAAQGESFANLVTSPYVPPDMLVLYQVTFYTKNSYSTLGQCSIAAFTKIIGPSRIVNSTSATYHNSLAGLESAAPGITWGHVSDQTQTIGGIKTFSDTSNATNTQTGSLIVLGGSSVVKDFYVGGSIESTSTLTSTSITTGALQIAGGAGINQLYVATTTTMGGNLSLGTNNISTVGGITATGIISTTNATLATSTNSGAVQVAGGLGVGQIYIAQTTNATSTTTGSLIVSGGTSIAGNLYVGGNVVYTGSNNSSTVESTSTSTGALIIAGGTGIAKNLYVGGNIVSSDIYTGLSTVNSTSTTTGSLILNGGASIAGNLYVGGNVVYSGSNNSSTVDSTSTSTGSLILSGGIGVAKQAHIGNTLTIHNITTGTNSCSLNVNTSGALTINSSGNICNFDVTDQVSINATTNTSSTNVGALIIAGGIGIAKNLYVGGNENISGNLGVSGNIGISGNMQVSGSGSVASLSVASLSINDTTNSTSSTTGALIMSGGAGISKNLYVGGNLNVAGSVSYGSLTITGTTLSTSTSTGTLIVNGGVGIAKSCYAANHWSANIGIPAPQTNLMYQAYDTQNSYIQNNIQNLSNGVSASSDYIATCDTGTESYGYIDVGINGSGYVSGYGGACDGYLYVKGLQSGVNGNLYIGTWTDNMKTYFTNGSGNTNIMSITGSGVNALLTSNSTDTLTGSLVISGGASVAKNLYIGGNLNVGGTMSFAALSLTNTTQATSTSTGTLIVAGGASVAKNLYVGGLLNVAGALQYTTLGITGSTQATNTSTGALTVVGGVGIGKNLYVGGNLSVAGSLSYTNLALSGTDLSSSIDTGALQVVGGAGLGQLYVEGNITTGVANGAFVATLSSTVNADFTLSTLGGVATTSGTVSITGGKLVMGNLSYASWPCDSTIDNGTSGTVRLRITGSGTGSFPIFMINRTIVYNRFYVWYDSTTSTIVVHIRDDAGDNITPLGTTWTYNMDDGLEHYVQIQWEDAVDMSVAVDGYLAWSYYAPDFSGRLPGTTLAVGNTLGTAGMIGTSVRDLVVYNQLVDLYHYNTTYTTSTVFTNGGYLKMINGVNATSISTGVVQVSGGVGIAKNLYVGGTLNVAGSIQYTSLAVTATTQATSTSTGAVIVGGGIGIRRVCYAQNYCAAGNVGGTFSEYAGTVFNGIDSSTDWIQINIQNTGSGTNSTTDIVATCDAGSDTTGYINFGINSSGHSGSVGAPCDGYLFVKGGTGVGYGDLYVGTISASAKTFFVSGTSYTNIMSIGSNAAVVVTTQSSGTSTGSLVVSGGVGIAKNVNIGGTLTKGGGSFLIPHPDPSKPDWHLRHCFVETNTRGDNIYRFVVTTLNNTAIITLPTYYKFLNENTQIFVSPADNFGAGYGVIDDTLQTVTITTNLDGKYNVLVIGTRNDALMKEYWDTDGAEIPPPPPETPTQ